MTDLIGARHPTMQRLRRLSRRRSARTDQGAFVIDGPILLGDALDALEAGDDASVVPGRRPVLDEVVVEPACPPALVDRALAAGATVHRAAAGSLGRVSDTVTAQPVAAIARLPRLAIVDAVATAGPLALVLVGVGDPGNAGTLVRSGEAAGAGAVLFCDGSVDPFGPKCVRSSAGSVLRVGVVREAAADDVLRALDDAGMPTVAAVARGGAPYDEIDLAGPVAVVLGSEAHGLPERVSSLVGTAVSIPMAGRTESLNVGMAGTVLCFEALRQRRARARVGRQRNQLDGTPPEAAGCTST